MGTFQVTVEVAASPEGPFEPIEALVGSGSTLALLPRAQLERLGVAVAEVQTLIHADGSKHEHEVGKAWLRLGDEAELVPVVFGGDEAEPQLGGMTLTALRLEVDGATETLRPLTLYLPGIRLVEQP